jgi:hypothetical protein
MYQFINRRPENLKPSQIYKLSTARENSTANLIAPLCDVLIIWFSTAYTMPDNSHKPAQSEQHPTRIHSSRPVNWRCRVLTNSQLTNITAVKTTRIRPPVPSRLPGRTTLMSSPKDIQMSGRMIEYPSNEGIEAREVRFGTSPTSDVGGAYRFLP